MFIIHDLKEGYNDLSRSSFKFKNHGIEIPPNTSVIYMQIFYSHTANVTSVQNDDLAKLLNDEFNTDLL